MIKLTKYLKPFIGSIIVIIALLFVQAISELSLPDYMSNIVNVGIQQGGIENSVPKIIRKSEKEKLSLFISESDLNKVEDSYKLINKDNLSENELNDYLKKYPLLNQEDLYELNTNNKEIVEELSSILAKPELIVYGINSGNMEEFNNNNSNSEMNLPENTDIFTVFKNLPKEKINEMLKGMNENIDSMPESIVKQSSVAFVKDEYKAVGIDTDSLQTRYIAFAGLKMLGIAFISMVATVIVGLLSARMAAGIGKTLRKDVFKKVTSFSNAEFDKFSTASLITRNTNDIQQIQMLMVMLFRIVFYAPILGIGGVLKVLRTDTNMTWIITLGVILIVLLVGVLFTFAMPKFKAVQKLIDKLNLVTRESLTGMLVIRAFSTQKHEEERFDKANKNLTNTNLFVNRLMSSMMPVMMFIMNGLTILIVWIGAHQVDLGNMQVGNMMAFMQYAMQIIMSFLMISMISIMLPRASVSAQRISEVLNSTLSIEDKKETEKFKASKKGYVEYKNVSFKYPGAEDYVIKDISFVAKPGETTAIKGSTGSGKSTLINLIPRFYDVTEGKIEINGVDIRNVKQKELREKIGYVPQKGVLFSGTIESNLKYGSSEAKMKDIKLASNIAQATEFIESKPDKYNSEISQGGTNVSGGQKQRLSIARALVKKPEIYVFDDSFSALDFKTDSALRKAIKENIKDATMIIVAQRISTIKDANQIIVLDEGEVVGIGTHRELLENCEVYNQIALSQLSKEELMS